MDTSKVGKNRYRDRPGLEARPEGRGAGGISADSADGPSGGADLSAAITAAAAATGSEVFAHAVDIDTGAQVAYRAETPVVTGSVFKVPVLTEYVRQVADGRLDPDGRLTIDPQTVAPGSTGLSVFTGETTWTIRDIATSMITVSDNAATDILMGVLGLDNVNRTMAELGLPDTVLTGDCRSLFASMMHELGAASLSEVDAILRVEPRRVPGLAVCTPGATNRSTARESTELLRLLWSDRAAAPAACAQARRILGLQVWPHRLASGFPDDAIRIAGKTGTIGIVRNEIGVVEYPDGQRLAIAVFTRDGHFRFRQPRADALIGTVASLLAGALRNPQPPS